MYSREETFTLDPPQENTHKHMQHKVKIYKSWPTHPCHGSLPVGPDRGVEILIGGVVRVLPPSAQLPLKGGNGGV